MEGGVGGSKEGLVCGGEGGGAGGGTYCSTQAPFTCPCPQCLRRCPSAPLIVNGNGGIDFVETWDFMVHFPRTLMDMQNLRRLRLFSTLLSPLIRSDVWGWGRGGVGRGGEGGFGLGLGWGGWFWVGVGLGWDGRLGVGVGLGLGCDGVGLGGWFWVGVGV